MSAHDVLKQAFHEAEVECDWDAEGHAAHALDALKAAGYAVVELPKPDHIAERVSEVDAAWSAYPEGDPANDARWPGPYRVAADGDEIEFGGNNLLPEEAEALGAVLLASAAWVKEACRAW